MRRGNRCNRASTETATVAQKHRAYRRWSLKLELCLNGKPPQTTDCNTTPPAAAADVNWHTHAEAAASTTAATSSTEVPLLLS